MNKLKLYLVAGYATFILGALAPSVAQPQSAAASIPDGPIRIIVPTTAGTTPDLIARIIGPKLGERLGRPVVVENRVGASSAIGTEAVVRAAPNGSTLLMAASTMASGASLQSTSYDPLTDLTHISLMGWTRLVLVTPPNSKYKTLRELVAAAQTQPDALNYSSPGTGTPNHLAGELLKVRAAASLKHIPYRASAQQITGLLSGEVDTGFITVIAAAPLVKAGKLSALAVTGSKRSSLIPTVPAFSEIGVGGVEGSLWYGLFGPKGMHPELVARLNSEFKVLLHAEEKTLAEQGFEVETNTPSQFRQLLADDIARWADLVKTQGIKAE